MRQEIRELIDGTEKSIELPREEGTEVLSHWRRTRCPLRPPLNYFIMRIAKLSPFQRLTRWIYRTLLGMKIGKNVSFAPFDVDPLLPELITIGDNSAIGWKATILCHYFTQNRQKFGRVTIGRDVLIGAMSFIGPGVEIGDGAVVAMNSLVIKDIPAGQLWGGVPACRILNGPEADALLLRSKRTATGRFRD